jgi:hypothetical protein
MVGKKILPLVFAAVLSWAGVSCCQMGPMPLPAVPAARIDPPVALASLDRAPRQQPEAVLASASVTVNPQVPPMPDSSKPGGKVAWRTAPPLRAAPSGVGTFLADVESRLPPQMGTRYRDKSRVTWCHETTHGVHADLRNRFHLPAFYPGGGKFALVEPPAITLGEVAAAVPSSLRGSRYPLYLVRQRREWDRDPLYVWDEWVAYDNGTTTGIEEAGRSQAGLSDDAMACIEMAGYALAVAAAARHKGVPVSDQFREFLAWELRRSLALYAKAMTLPDFAWPDRRLERAWRAGDPFVVDELRALYGEALTVRDLLPQGALVSAREAVSQRPAAK